MQYQLLVQSQSDHSYVAAVLGVPDCVAAGQTKDGAIAKAKAALEDRLAKSEIVTIEVAGTKTSAAENPLLRSFGAFKDDPTYDDFLERIAEYRRELDEEEAARYADGRVTAPSAADETSAAYFAKTPAV